MKNFINFFYWPKPFKVLLHNAPQCTYAQRAHSSFEMKKSGDQFPRKVTTCSRHYKPKLILPLKSVLLYNIPFTLKIAFEKMKLFKMHQIIKPTCPSRQLFIKITFAFIKIFDFLVKIAIFGAFLFQSRDSRHALLPGSSIGFRQ